MKRGERGFTLLEALIVIAITGVIIWPLAMATTTLLTNPQRSADQNVVLREVRNAGYWISRDVQMARTVTLGAPKGFPLTLDIAVDADENHDYEVDYLFDGSKLKRKEYDSSHTLISETFIADYIATGNTTFSTLGLKLHKLTIRASKGQAVVTMNYEVSQRL